ncbi:MAG: hypothetical protein ABIK09_15950 [Pseudomonadota bacterium]
MRSLLLIEFAVIERFHRAVEFPYLLGQARARGVPARWVRFGVHAAAEFHGIGSGVPMSPEDAMAAAAHMDALDADHVIFSHKPAETLVAALNRGRSDRRYHYMEFSSRGETVTEVMDGAAVERLIGGLDALPGVPAAERGAKLLEADAPDFGFIPGNPAAAEIEVLPFLFIGDECTWNRPFLGNPFYQGLDLSGCFRTGGCAFCARPENRSPSPVDPMERLRRQLTALSSTCPTFGRRLRVRLVGEPVIHNIEAVAAQLLEADLPGADLLLDSRADTLVRRADAVRSALTCLQGSDHCLHLCLIGIESFSSRELGRLNKGTDAAGNLAAVRTLLDLEAEHPQRFAFREYGGLSLIPFTPWTAPEELDLNLAVLEVLDLAPYSGKHPDGRLRLYPGLPLEARARADGLLRECYEDPLLDTARRTFYENELPWAFRDPVMEPLNRLLTRLEFDGEDVDPLTHAVRALDDQARGGSLPRTALAHSMIQAALRLAWNNGSMEPEALLDAVRGSNPDPGAGTAAPDFEEWITRDPPLLDDPGRLELPLSRALVLKPVSRVEPLQSADAARWVAAPDLPNPVIRRRAVDAGASPVDEVFFGHRLEDVLRGVALTNALEAGLPDAEATATYREIGTLLGYPACCAGAYAAAPSHLRSSYFWLHVANRIRFPGEVPWELNPFPGILVEYVPCGLDCAASLVRARGILDALPWQSSASRSAFEASLQTPRVLFHEEQSSGLELIPEDEPGERFRYHAGRRHGESADVEALATGDELEVGPETLLVLRHGRPWASLSGRAFLWWHRRPLQVAFWEGMLSVRRHAPRCEEHAPVHTDAAVDSPAPLSPVLGVLDRLLHLFRRNQVDLGGLAIHGWLQQPGGRTTVRLSGPGAEVQLVVEERREGVRALWEEGPYALSYPSDAPLQSDAQWRGARAFRAALRAALRRLGYPFEGD